MQNTITKMTNETIENIANEYCVEKCKDGNIEFYVTLKNFLKVKVKNDSLEFKFGDFSLKGEIVKVGDEKLKDGTTYFKYFLKNADYKKEPK